MHSPGTLFAVCLLATSLSARSLPVRRFESNIVPLAIAQGRDGVLWLATADGLVRFDGLHYEPVHSPAARDIDVSPGGAVWMATDNGLVRYDRGRFTRELPGRLITALIVTAGGRLLAATNEDLYIALEPDKLPVRWSVQTHISVHARFQADLDGKTWFGCGLYLCVWSDADIREVAGNSPWTRHRSPSPSNREGVQDRQWDWADIVATPDRRIWARNGPDVFEFGDGRSLRRNLPVETFQGVRPGFLLDRRGRLWIPGRQLHVVEKGELEVFRGTGAPLQDVTAMFEDRRGTLWFGLAGKGLAALPDETSLQSWAEPDGISGSVLDLTFDSRQNLVAATNTGGFAFDAAHSRWSPLGNVGGAEALRGILAGPGGTLLSLPYSGGLLRDGREIRLPEILNRRRMRHLVRDREGTIWIASTDGLYRYDAAGAIERVALPENSIYASDLQADADGRLWVGYEGGVALCTAAQCTRIIAPADGLADPRIRSISARNDEIWVAYRPSVGFTRFVHRPDGWTATQFSPAQGYGPQDTHFLRRDHRGWIWRGSTDGVYVCDGVHTEPEDWLHLTFGDDINASYANMYAWLEQPDGEIWIGTQKGVVRLHPTADWFPAPLPQVSPPAATLRAHQDLELHLSQPGLPPFQSHLFRYRLLPLDPQWRFSSTGVVRYARLAAGSYRVQVAAGGGRPPVEYSFRVEGNASLLWSIGIGSGMLLGALAWGFVLWRRRRRAAGAAQDYWRQKREFLERREAEAPAAVAPDDWSGRSLDGRFLLEKRIAGGGFAAVYRGSDQANGGEPVAVKLFHPLLDNEHWRRRRFVEEVTVLQRLHDAGIVGIRFAGEAAADRPYLVMEFIEGITLRALLQEGRLELERAANLLGQIGRALAAAHGAGVLHRDLKPENIMIRDAGRPEERIKLIDFGIASLVEEQTQEHTTKLAGSPGYLAPERWVGLASQRSDVYSLAAIAAEMIAGVPLGELGYCAGNLTAYRERMLALRTGLPSAALDLLVSALAYDPEARPADAAAFVRDLSQTLTVPAPATGMPSGD